MASPPELTGQRVVAGFATQHRITVDGRKPGTIPCLQVAARNAAGTGPSMAAPSGTSGEKKR